ncbi:MAG: permease prefix domain 1-containing protein [Oscillospiraceae bacterium]|nr:permease prefix domain 1-containing protein [Oscillospiraceae bacterium]
MQKFMSDYLDEVCAAVRGSALKQAARIELTDHMKERYADLTQEGFSEENAALETVKRMGEAEVLGKRITAANRSVYAILAPLCGLGLFVFALVLMFFGKGGRFAYFYDPSSFLGVTGLTVAFGVLSCKSKPELIKFIRGFKSGALYAGGIIWVVGIILMLNRMAEDPASVGFNIAVAMISLLYGLLLSAAAKIAENHITVPEAGAIRGLLE